jgi:hypothetical protein
MDWCRLGKPRLTSENVQHGSVHHPIGAAEHCGFRSLPACGDGSLAFASVECYRKFIRGRLLRLAAAWLLGNGAASA